MSGLKFGSIAVLSLTVAACSQTAGGELNGSSKPSAQPSATEATAAVPESDLLRNALSDGKVTFDEYQAGYDRYSACVAAAGYALFNPKETNMVMSYSIPEAAVADGKENSCYLSEFGPLDANWQIQRENTSYSAQIMRACLERNKIAPADTVDKMTKQLIDAGISLESCLS